MGGYKPSRENITSFRTFKISGGRCWQYVPGRRWCPPIKLHVVIIQNPATWIRVNFNKWLKMTRVENGENNRRHNKFFFLATSWRWQISYRNARTCAVVTVVLTSKHDKRQRSKLVCSRRDHSSSILCEFRCSQDGGHAYVHAVVHTTRYFIACWISKTDIPCSSRDLGQTPVDWNDLDSLGYAPGSILRPRVCLLPLGILICRITTALADRVWWQFV